MGAQTNLQCFRVFVRVIAIDAMEFGIRRVSGKRVFRYCTVNIAIGVRIFDCDLKGGAGACVVSVMDNIFTATPIADAGWNKIMIQM